MAHKRVQNRKVDSDTDRDRRQTPGQEAICNGTQYLVALFTQKIANLYAWVCV